jgi:hypothetical protein
MDIITRARRQVTYFTAMDFMWKCIDATRGAMSTAYSFASVTDMHEYARAHPGTEVAEVWARADVAIWQAMDTLYCPYTREKAPLPVRPDLMNMVWFDPCVLWVLRMTPEELADGLAARDVRRVPVALDSWDYVGLIPFVYVGGDVTVDDYNADVDVLLADVSGIAG